MSPSLTVLWGCSKSMTSGLSESELRALHEGEFLLENYYISLDADFRNWMSEGSGDNILTGMPLDEPVMGLTLSRIIDSHHRDYAVGQLMMSRVASEEYSIADGTDQRR